MISDEDLDLLVHEYEGRDIYDQLVELQFLRTHSRLLADALMDITATCLTEDAGGVTYDVSGHAVCVKLADRALLIYEASLVHIL